MDLIPYELRLQDNEKQGLIRIKIYKKLEKFVSVEKK